MAVKVVTITADKGGSFVRQEESMAKAKHELQQLLDKATRTISVNTKEDESKFEFIAVVDLPEVQEEEKKEDSKDERSHHKSSLKKENKK